MPLTPTRKSDGDCTFAPSLPAARLGMKAPNERWDGLGLRAGENLAQQSCPVVPRRAFKAGGVDAAVFLVAGCWANCRLHHLCSGIVLDLASANCLISCRWKGGRVV